ncbi:MAG TPA: C-terminal helicase domain-containing protein [Rhodoglobus sp.]|nr:C-terminal helicase domain-containing protein [Rhodoglobus sp.]
MVLSLKVGGTGLNLTAASHVIHFDRWWNPAAENQASDRAYRIGQTRNVMVHKFVCRGTLEQRIDELLRIKQTLADDILSERDTPHLANLGPDELLGIVRLDVAGADAGGEE